MLTTHRTRVLKRYISLTLVLIPLQAQELVRPLFAAPSARHSSSKFLYRPPFRIEALLVLIKTYNYSDFVQSLIRGSMNEIITDPVLSMKPGRVKLLRLPAELRLQILSFALSTDCGDRRIASFDTARKFRKPVSHSTTNIGVLLVCRQIYYEARMLPFQNSAFAFQRWYGSSTAECLKFLQKLQPWQIGMLRSLKLAVTEADLGGLSCVDEVCSWLVPNSIDGLEGELGLQHLSIHISRAGNSPDPADFEALFDLGRKWWIQGILKITSLRTLKITIAASIMLPGQATKAFEEQLQEQMPWCSNATVVVKQEKSPRQKFDDFARAMGWGPDGPGSL